MRYVVKGPNGIMTVFSPKPLSEAELILRAQQCAAERDLIIPAMRHMLYRGTTKRTD